MRPAALLAVRSGYSLMWGTAGVERLCRRARELGYRRLALTDTDNLYGLWPWLAACRREGIAPIVGAELSARDGRQRAVCLVREGAGYRNLCRLISRRHGDPDFELGAAVAAHGNGLAVLTGCASLLQHWHAAGLCVAAAMPRRALPASHRLRRLATALGVPLVATAGSFFLDAGDYHRHRLLRAIAGRTTIERVGPAQFAPADAWLPAPQEMRQRFALCPESLDAAEALAESLAGFTGPEFGVVMPPWSDGGGLDAAACLRHAAYAGARWRYGHELSEALVERLEKELGIIATMGFAGYFLVVREIVRRSPRTCGRGSGAASLVAYCLGITNVCPLKHNLYFERFLHPGRRDPPDIDVDFAWDERDAVIDSVLERYRGRAAMVASHILFQPRMALREVARVYGLPDAEIGRVTRRLPWFWHADGLAADMLAELRRRPETAHLAFPAPWPAIIADAQRLIGLPRHLSVHPGGVVITPGPLDDYVPIETAPKGVPVIQWEKEGAEAAGLVKIDLLGNRSLAVIRDAVAGAAANGRPIEERRWEPEDDPDTQEAVALGRTMGCFYIESPAMRLLQQRARVGDFEHLVIHSSIIRPAANEFIREYLRRLHGGAWQPLHPLLADVLEESFGILVYQEDVSRVAVALAGFSAAEADALRKVLSKKERLQQLRDFETRFAAGAAARGVSAEVIGQLWRMMMSFDGYSFCKPHSASYARVSFQAAWLKVHRPAEFMAAVINNGGGFYSTSAYVSEARRMGLAIRPPDVNRSQIGWQGREMELRVGLAAVNGLSGGTLQRIVADRHRRPFRDMADFLARARPAADEGRALVHSGALDGLEPGCSRAALMWHLAAWRRSMDRRQSELFAAPPPAAPPLPADDPRGRLEREMEVLGFLCGCHPVTLWARRTAGRRAVSAAALTAHVGRRVALTAWLVTGKVVHTRQGEPMEFLTFEDETGLVETTFFPETYRRTCHLLEAGRPYHLVGTVEEEWGAVTLTVEAVKPLASPGGTAQS